MCTIFKKNLYWFRFVVLILFSFISTICEGTIDKAEDFGARWVKSLNHRLPEEAGESEKLPMYVSSQKKQENEYFDIDKIHEKLSVEEKKVAKLLWPTSSELTDRKNLVVAAMSMIIRMPDGSYAAFNYPLAQVFISGSTSFARPSISQAKKAGELFGAGRCDVADLHESLQARLKDHPNTKIAALRETWWKEQLRILSTAQEMLHQVEQMEAPSMYRYQHKQSALINEANANVGSTTDSEQYLLNFLRGNFYTPIKLSARKIKGIFVDMKSDFEMVRRSVLRSELLGVFDRMADASDRRAAVDEHQHSITEFLRDVQELEDYNICGFVLHLHSTNELCGCCAASLSSELYNEGGNFRTLGRELGRYQVPQRNEIFFTATVSCSQRLKPTEDPKIAPGVPDSHSIDEPFSTERMIAENWVPQRCIN